MAESARVSIVRARRAQSDDAIRLIEEYQDSIGVIVRDDRSAIRGYLECVDQAIWLAYADENPIGCIAFRLLVLPKRAGEMKRLYVRESLRGQGIAGKLLFAVEEHAVATGCTSLYLDSRSDLVKAVHFYERRGYFHCERYNDNPQATVFMKKEFVASLSVSALTIRPFAPGDAEAFRLLNEAWIAKLFRMEAKDHEVLNDPEGKILAGGGQIFMATREGVCIGCCALIAMGDGVFELSKMAVAEQERGRGVGRQILEWVVAEMRRSGVMRLYLETNSSLKNAIHLYEAVGFRQVAAHDLSPSLYERADVFMEVLLGSPEACRR